MEENKTMKKINNEYGKRFYAKHFVQGVAEYEGDDGNFRLLARNEQINDMAKTFEGKPVVVFHQSIEESELREKMAGMVVRSFYNKCDGWHWCEIMVFDAEALEAIENKKWSVSNSYVPNLKEVSDSYLNVPYEFELTSGVYDHLAIVPNPRYEDSIVLTPDDFKAYNDNLETKISNSKKETSTTKENRVMLKLFKKVPVEKDVNVEETSIQLENGKELSLAEMIEVVTNQKEEEAKEEEKKENEKDLMEEDIMVNGDKMKIKDLVNAYHEAMKKEEKKENEKEEEEKEEKKENEKMENEKNVETLKAEGNFDEVVKTIENAQNDKYEHKTERQKVETGKDKY